MALFFGWFVWTMLINHLSPLVGQFNQQYFFVYSRKCFQKEGFSSILVDILCNKRRILINNFSWRKTWNIKIVFKALKALNFPIPLWKSSPWWQSQPKFSTWRLRFYEAGQSFFLVLVLLKSIVDPVLYDKFKTKEDLWPCFQISTSFLFSIQATHILSFSVGRYSKCNVMWGGFDITPSRQCLFAKGRFCFLLCSVGSFLNRRTF